MTPTQTYQLMVRARHQISCWGGSLVLTAAPSIACWYVDLHICSLEFDFPDWLAMLAPGVKWFIIGIPWKGQEENHDITSLEILWQLTCVRKHSLLLPCTFVYQQKMWAFFGWFWFSGCSILSKMLFHWRPLKMRFIFLGITTDSCICNSFPSHF